MAKTVNKLTDRAVRALAKPGLHGDGDNLWLQIGPAGGKSWLFRYRFGGRQREMGLGAFPSVGLAGARKAADEARAILRGNGVNPGEDPLERKRALSATARREAKQGVSFRQAAERYISAHEATWKNRAHRAQWPSTLTSYVYPVFGELAVSGVDTGLVLKAIEPIWNTKPETAARVRGRIETVLDWATARGYRRGDNPARWRGHLDKLLPPRARVRAVAHHPALPYGDMGAFMADLRGREGMAARALEFAILSAARTGEVIGATWSEIDLDARVWTIPAARMKAAREHRVPLSDAAMALLTPLHRVRASEAAPVFPGGSRSGGLSNMAMDMLMRRLGKAAYTVHGFRSTFRDWAAERSSFANEVIEMALAHVIANKVEAAYRRGDLIDKRKRLMDAWAAYCAEPAKSTGATPIRRSA